MPRRVFRVIKCACGEEVTLLLAGLDPVECRQCGAQYDPRMGDMLPVCEGFELPADHESRPMRGRRPRAPAPG